MERKPSISRKVRMVVQIVFFILVVLIVLSHSLGELGITIPLIQGASLHAVCPFGGVVSLYQYITQGTFVQKIHDSSFYLMLIVFITAIIAGPVFCGWICPFGTFQEWIGKIGRRIFGKRYNAMVPAKLDRLLRYLRYVVLVWIVVMTAISAKLVFSAFDPYFALFNFWTGEVAITGFAVLGVVIALSLVIERPFCKYACPYGALLGVTNLFRVFKVRRNTSTCIDCKACDRACPMNIKVSATQTVHDHQCIACMACTSEQACPVKRTVELNTRTLGETSRKKTGITLKSLPIAIGLVVFILGTILLLSALGLWKTEGTKIPAKIQTGEYAGQFDPGDIRGSYSFADIEQNFGITASDLATAFGLDTTVKPAEAYLAKDLETAYPAVEGAGEIGTDSLRWFTALYLGLPHTPEDSTLLPQEAWVMLWERGKISEALFNQAGMQAIPMVGTDSTVIESPIKTEESRIIKGSTTYADLLAWGLTQTQIEEVLPYPIADPSIALRDFLSQKGLEFSTYKTILQQLLDAL